MKKTNAEESEKHNSKTNEQLPLKWSIPVRSFCSRLLVSVIGLDTSCQFSEWMEKRLPNEHRFTNSGTLLGQLIWIGIGGNGQIELTNISQKRIIYYDNLFGSVVDSTVARFEDSCSLGTFGGWFPSQTGRRWCNFVSNVKFRTDLDFLPACNLRHYWALIIPWRII